MKAELINSNTQVRFTTDEGKVLTRRAYYNKSKDIYVSYLVGQQYFIREGSDAVESSINVESPIVDVDFGDIVYHSEYQTIRDCVELDIPVYLYGPAGSGKNYTLQMIADQLGLTFYFTNAVQEIYNLTGFIDANGTFHETEFYKAFSQGGVFFLDEMDASIPDVLVKLNAAIANRYFDFPNGKITAHKDFRVVAAGNTIGSGANELYTGRQVLDAASLDRFVAIKFNYDRNIELSLAKGNVELVDFINSLRAFANEHGVRATFSYRSIISVSKLERTGMALDKILEIAVFKGLEKSTIATMVKNATTNKYGYAMKRMVM